ncbi:MAG: GNAT family N-acetyltransferase [Caulobacterales bacterium]|nr:GNAT family N-acetyltransferase [Caulobacterales bacterium]
MSTVTVELAGEAQAPACLALLPTLRQPPAELLIARRGGQLVGAAGVVWRHRREGEGFPLEVTVLPAARRQGVGRRLVEAAEALVRGEAPGLWSHGALDEASEAAAFARACGFVVRRREHHFRADVGRAVDYVKPVVTRLRERGHIPTDARIAPLRETPLDEVGWLVSAEFGGGPEAALGFLQGSAGAGALDLDRSLAVMQGDRVAGVVLARLDGDCPLIEAAIVAPAWRNGWANAVLLEAITAVGQAGGTETFRFHCDEQVLSSMQLAEKTGAAREATAADFYRAVEAC